MNLRRTDLFLGVFFFAALIGLGTMTIVLSDFALGRVSYDVELYSSDVGYLRPGDPVLLHGMASGKVVAIERLPEMLELTTRGRTEEAQPVEHETTVKITARLDVNLVDYLKPDFQILIEDRGFLGGKLIRVDVGEEDGAIDREKPLVALAVVSALQTAGTILEENRASVRNTMDNFERISAEIASGEGSLGQFIMEDGIATRAETTLDAIGEVFDGVKNGKGTIGKLFTDETLHDDVQSTFANVTEITDGVIAGEGTVGKLFTETELHDDIQTAVGNISEITDGVVAGEGTAGKLFKDDTLHDTVLSAFESIDEAAAGIREGDGLLAALINDKDLADNFRSILAQVLGAIEDARETTPVQSVGSFLFGTF